MGVGGIHGGCRNSWGLEEFMGVVGIHGGCRNSWGLEELKLPLKTCLLFES